MTIEQQLQNLPGYLRDEARQFLDLHRGYSPEPTIERDEETVHLQWTDSVFARLSPLAQSYWIQLGPRCLSWTHLRKCPEFEEALENRRRALGLPMIKGDSPRFIVTDLDGSAYVEGEDYEVYGMTITILEHGRIKPDQTFEVSY